MSFAPVTDILEQALARLLSEFQGLPNWEDMIGTLVAEIQVAEDTTSDLVLLRDLSTAAGVNLDQYGVLLDEDRGGLTDDEYRAILSVKILANRSLGEIERLLTIVNRLTGSLSIDIQDVPPAGFSVSYAVSPPLSTFHRNRVVRFLRLAKSGAVRLDSVVEATLNYFGFEEDADAMGFDDGIFAELIS